jgi:hypothetical protein
VVTDAYAPRWAFGTTERFGSSVLRLIRFPKNWASTSFSEDRAPRYLVSVPFGSVPVYTENTEPRTREDCKVQTTTRMDGDELDAAGAGERACNAATRGRSGAARGRRSRRSGAGLGTARRQH